MAEKVHWSIDGRHVQLRDWQASSTSAGGYDQLTARADRDDVEWAHQGSHVRAHLEDGSEMWFGYLDATPAASRLREATVTATGPVARLRRMRGNWLAWVTRAWLSP